MISRRPRRMFQTTLMMMALLIMMALILMTVGSATAQLEWDGSGTFGPANPEDPGFCPLPGCPFPDSYNITSNTYRADHFFGAPNPNGFVSSIGNLGGMLGNNSLGITKAQGWEVDFGWASIGDDVFPEEKHFISMGDDTNNLNLLLDNPSGDEFGGTARLLSNGTSNVYSTLVTGLKFSQPSRSTDPVDFHRFQMKRAPGADNVTLLINGTEVANLIPSVCGLPGCDDGNLNVFYIGPSQQEGTFDYINVLEALDPNTTEYRWNNTGFGDWAAGDSNWWPGQFPNSRDHTAIFADTIVSPSTVITDEAVTVNKIVFDHNQSYVIAGFGSVNLQATSLNTLPEISVMQGAHQIQALTTISSDTTVNIAADSTLTFHNALNLNGRSLTKTGAGTVEIRNDLVTAGGTLLVVEGTVLGNGTVGGDLMNTGGTISPGNSSDSLTGPGQVPEPTAWLLAMLGLAGLYARRWDSPR